MNQFIGVKGHVQNPEERARKVISSIWLLSAGVDSVNHVLKELSQVLGSIHADYGTWIEYLKQVPEETRGKLLSLSEELQNRQLGSLALIGQMAKRNLEGLMSGEDFYKLLFRDPPAVKK
jgi:hypothetical protein